MVPSFEVAAVRRGVTLMTGISNKWNLLIVARTAEKMMTVYLLLMNSYPNGMLQNI